MGGGSDFYECDRDREFERRMYEARYAFQHNTDDEECSNRVCGTCKYRINPNGGVAWCAKHKDRLVKLMEQACDMYKVGDPWDSPEEPHQYRPYRPWNVLLEEPDDMTDAEKARLKRIKQIPKVAFDSCLTYAETLRDKVMELEAEYDKIMDYLNGEEK